MKWAFAASVAGVAACSLVVDTGGLTGGVPVDAAAPEGGSDAEVDAAREAAAVDVAPEAREAGSTYADVVLADHPLAYYRFDDTLPVAKDSSGNGHDGTYHDAVSVAAPGAIEGSAAASFAGGYVGTGKNFGFEGLAPCSFEAWVKVTIDADYHTIVARNDRDANYKIPDGYFWVFNPAPGGELVFVRVRSGNSDSVTSTVPGTGWAHVALTFDGATLRTYVNGAKVASNAATQSIISSTNEFTIGADGGGSFSMFRGAMDEVAVYGDALSDARIMAHYAAGLAH